VAVLKTLRVEEVHNTNHLTQRTKAAIRATDILQRPWTETEYWLETRLATNRAHSEVNQQAVLKLHNIIIKAYLMSVLFFRN
jgi:hypothetical protein